MVMAATAARARPRGGGQRVAWGDCELSGLAGVQEDSGGKVVDSLTSRFISVIRAKDSALRASTEVISPSPLCKKR